LSVGQDDDQDELQGVHGGVQAILKVYIIHVLDCNGDLIKVRIIRVHCRLQNFENEIVYLGSGVGYLFVLVKFL
jgi:hypothetical protein